MNVNTQEQRNTDVKIRNYNSGVSKIFIPCQRDLILKYARRGGVGFYFPLKKKKKKTCMQEKTCWASDEENAVLAPNNDRRKQGMQMISIKPPRILKGLGEASLIRRVHNINMRAFQKQGSHQNVISSEADRGVCLWAIMQQSYANSR